MLITGQAGCGKYHLVCEMIRQLRSRGAKVVVVCSSGLAFSVYDKSFSPSTVHSQYALLTADLPSEQVVERVACGPHIVSRIISDETIIWDEASMSSARILHGTG